MQLRGDGYTFAASNAALALAQLGDTKGSMVGGRLTRSRRSRRPRWRVPATGIATPTRKCIYMHYFSAHFSNDPPPVGVFQLLVLCVLLLFLFFFVFGARQLARARSLAPLVSSSSSSSSS